MERETTRCVAACQPNWNIFNGLCYYYGKPDLFFLFCFWGGGKPDCLSPKKKKKKKGKPDFIGKFKWVMSIIIDNFFLKKSKGD